MADPLSIAAIGWGLTATGWFVSPYITRLLEKAYAHIKPGKSRKKIQYLVTHTVPRLKLILEAAEGNAKKHLYEELLTDLKSALYATEDILDEVEYLRRHQTMTERKLVSCVDKGPSNQVTKHRLCWTGCFKHERCLTSCFGTSSNLTIPGALSNLLKENVTMIEKLLEQADRTMKHANPQSNEGSNRHKPNVAAENMEMPTFADPTGEVIGREKALDNLKIMLRQTEDDGMPSSSDRICLSSNSSAQLSVIGITGPPGSGKTTLAQYVCKSERDDSHFHLVMWIHVSEKFNVHRIYSEMFEQAWKKFGKKNKERPQNNGLETLSEDLKEILTGRRCLLILDGIWFSNGGAGEAELQKLLVPLKVGMEGSKILVTSRQNSISRLGPDVICTNYPIPDLDDKVFSDLFMYYALHKRHVAMEDKGKLQQIGVEIAQKLKKSPLLARVVGGILFQKPTIEVADWISIQEQNLLDNYMGSALWWSYQHLGEQVRQCFAYCSIFPRSYRLRRDELVNLWVAVGFINTTNRGQQMEDVARGYFNELLSTSFLLPGREDYLGEYFLIHDLLHDLSVKVAGSDCFKIENGIGWTGEVPPDVRHLSIQSCDASFITEHIVKLKKLRTLIIYNGEDDISQQVFEEMFSKLCKLRVLIFGTNAGEPEFSFPESIGCLKHLRYLGFRIWRVPKVTLPHNLSKLYLLQVLDLGYAGAFEFSCAEDMNNLIDLRHVIDEYVSFPNIGRLTSLQTMPTLNLECGEGYELHQLKDLNKLQGKLAIHHVGLVQNMEEALDAKLTDKKQLTELELAWDVSQKGYSPDLQADVLEGLCPPEYIKYLSISNYNGSRYPSWMVDTKKKTMYLHKLELELCCQPVCDPKLFFISVTSLVLRQCTWDTLPYNMVSLTLLELEDCDRLPSNMELLTSLKKLIIRGGRYDPTLPTLPRSLGYIELANYGIQNLSENQNWKKIKHIPRIVIDSVTMDDIEKFFEVRRPIILSRWERVKELILPYIRREMV